MGPRQVLLGNLNPVRAPAQRRPRRRHRRHRRMPPPGRPALHRRRRLRSPPRHAPGQPPRLVRLRPQPPALIQRRPPYVALQNPHELLLAGQPPAPEPWLARDSPRSLSPSEGERVGVSGPLPRLGFTVPTRNKEVVEAPQSQSPNRSPGLLPCLVCSPRGACRLPPATGFSLPRRAGGHAGWRPAFHRLRHRE